MDALKKLKELRRTLNDFRARGDAIKKSFADVEKFFDAGSFALPEMFDEFNRDVASWTNESAKCRKLWADIFNEPLPKTFADMETILTAQEKCLVEQNLFNRAEKFMHLTAEVPALKRSLAAHQRKLKTLLAKKRRGAKTKETVMLYAKFIDAFDETDFGQKFSSGKELSEFFGDDFIGAGLFGNALTFSDDTPVESLEDTPVEPIESIEDIPIMPIEPTVEPPIKLPLVDCAKILRKKDALLTDDELAPWTEKFIVDPEPTKKINVRHIKETFKLLPPNERFLLLGAMIFDRCFSIATLDPDKVSKAKNLSNAVQLLRRILHRVEEFFRLHEVRQRQNSFATHAEEIQLRLAENVQRYWFA